VETVQQLVHLSVVGPWVVVACCALALIGWVMFLLTCVVIVLVTGSTTGLQDFAAAVGEYRRPLYSARPRPPRHRDADDPKP
jgi:hypothetical protein